MIAKTTSKKSRYRGAAVVEAAIIFPLLVMLTFGVIEYGWMFLKAHQITNAARSGCRFAVRPDVTTDDVEVVIAGLMTSAGITIYQVTYTPGVDAGDAVTVKVSALWDDLAIMNIPLLPKPPSISALVTMAKEGPSNN
jgi:Flp pilus assembly protein TadG